MCWENNSYSLLTIVIERLEEQIWEKMFSLSLVCTVFSSLSIDSDEEMGVIKKESENAAPYFLLTCANEAERLSQRGQVLTWAR